VLFGVIENKTVPFPVIVLEKPLTVATHGMVLVAVHEHVTGVGLTEIPWFPPAAGITGIVPTLYVHPETGGGPGGGVGVGVGVGVGGGGGGGGGGGEGGAASWLRV